MEAKKHIFSPTERKLFLDILKKYYNIIENKNSERVSLRRKNEAWIRVATEYNASPLATRQATSKQLRRLWLNTKQRQKDALTKQRQHRLSTEVGPSIKDAYIDPDVVASALIVGSDYAIDSDAVDDSKELITPVTENIDNVVVLPPASYASRTINWEQTQEQYITADTHSWPKSPKPEPLSEPSTSQMTQPILQKLPLCSTNTPTPQLIKNNIKEQEYKDQYVWASEKHNLEIQILKQQLREAKAKADLAELILKKEQLREIKAKADLAELILKEQVREATAKAVLAELKLKHYEDLKDE